MTISEVRLEAGDRHAERCRTYDEFARQAQERVESAFGLPEDLPYLRIKARLFEFDALYHRFIAFSPYSVSDLSQERHLRPNWPSFGQHDFTHLCRTILFLVYGRLYALKPRSHRKTVNDLFYPASEDGKEPNYWVRAAFGTVPELPLGPLLGFANEVEGSLAGNTKGLVIWLRSPHRGQDAFVTGLNAMVDKPFFGVLTNVQLPELLRLCTTIRARWEAIFSGSETLDLGAVLNEKQEAQKKAQQLIERCYLS